MVKGVIFDMDGVLIDSQPLHFKVDLQVLKQFNVKDVTLEDVKKYAGMSNNDRWNKYKLDYNINENVDKIINTHVETLTKIIKEEKLEPISGVKELLEELKKANIKIGLASSSSYDFIYFVLDKINIREYFQVIQSGEDMKNSKPSPDIFLAAAEKLYLYPSECVVIEDSSNGVLASKNANIKCVGYVNINSGDQDLSLANIIVDNFNSLINNTDWLE